MADLAEAAFKELMVQALSSMGRGEGGESSEICPRGDLRLPCPFAPASDIIQEGREGTAPVRKEALCPPEALCLLKETPSPPKEALSPPKEALSPLKEAVAQLPPTDQSQSPSLGLERGFGGTSATVSIAIGSGTSDGTGQNSWPGPSGCGQRSWWSGPSGRDQPAHGCC